MDMRGYGESQKPDGIENYTIDKLINDVRELIEYLGNFAVIIVIFVTVPFVGLVHVPYNIRVATVSLLLETRPDCFVHCPTLVASSKDLYIVDFVQVTTSACWWGTTGEVPCVGPSLRCIPT